MDHAQKVAAVELFILGWLVIYAMWDRRKEKKMAVAAQREARDRRAKAQRHVLKRKLHDARYGVPLERIHP